eukprot:jgi/Mesen1/6084/ME000031S05354
MAHSLVALQSASAAAFYESQHAWCMKGRIEINQGSKHHVKLTGRALSTTSYGTQSSSHSLKAAGALELSTCRLCRRQQRNFCRVSRCRYSESDSTAALPGSHDPAAQLSAPAAAAFQTSVLRHPNESQQSAENLRGINFQQPPAGVSNSAGGRWQVDTRVLECCEPDKCLRVAVLVSGGVDSSVALRLLVAAGHKCTGFYIKIWFQEDFRNFWSECPWEEDLEYAQAVCDQVGVELRVVHLTDEYWQRVVAHSVAEIKAGRTPNPDILCNSHIKFGAFYDHLDPGEFDRVASGHYARVDRQQHQPGGALRLLMSADEVKDQTYFLSHLSQRQLQRLLFPLGCLPKAEVRQLAEGMGLPNQKRKDSQGICFLGKVKFSEFVAQHLGEQRGRLLEAETGVLLGHHRGFWFHTIGQRQGLGLSGGPWYVVAKDVRNNVVFVSNEYYAPHKSRRAFTAGDFSWIGGTAPALPALLLCKVRHGPKLYRCIVSAMPTLSAEPACQEEHRHLVLSGTGGAQQAPADCQEQQGESKQEGESESERKRKIAEKGERGRGEEGGERSTIGEYAEATVVLAEDDQGLAAGQYVAFYDEDSGACLGSGKILEAMDGSSGGSGGLAGPSQAAIDAAERGEQPPELSNKQKKKLAQLARWEALQRQQQQEKGEEGTVGEEEVETEAVLT